MEQAPPIVLEPIPEEQKVDSDSSEGAGAPAAKLPRVEDRKSLYVIVELPGRYLGSIGLERRDVGWEGGGPQPRTLAGAWPPFRHRTWRRYRTPHASICPRKRSFSGPFTPRTLSPVGSTDLSECSVQKPCTIAGIPALCRIAADTTTASAYSAIFFSKTARSGFSLGSK